MPESRHLVPLAIVVAGALVGAGLFFGLRGRTEPAPQATAPSAIEDGAMHSAKGLPSAAPMPPPSATGSPSRSAVLTRVGAALELQRKAISDACVKPALAKQPSPATVKYVLNFTLDASGNQITRGLAEDRETSRPDVTRCIEARLTPLSIGPLTESVWVEVPWTLP